MNDSAYEIYAFSVADKFGDNGVTGLCIIKIKQNDSKAVEIDSFLMSCRIIGRNIEYAFMDYLVKTMRTNRKKDNQCYLFKNKKNLQVEKFYNECSFEFIKQTNFSKIYVLNTNNYIPRNINYIKVKNGK